jgi:hypothetical protein
MKISSVYSLISAGLSSDIIECIRNGRIFIPEGIITPEIEKAVSRERGISLKACEFCPDNIRLALLIKKAWIQLTFHIIIKISEVRINSRKQEVDLSFSVKGPVGENTLGRFISFTSGGLLSRIAAKKIARSPFTTVSGLNKKDGRLVIDLGGLEKIRSLKKVLPVLNITLLDIITIQGIEHDAGGVRLKVGKS